MVTWGSFRRGQIRGIDFSLAMIIFLLTMSQVIVLTTTFIENSQSSQSLSSDQSATQNYAIDLITSPGSFGTGIDWYSQTTSTLTGSWQFGLGDGDGGVDVYKMGRIADNAAAPFILTNANLKSASTIDRDFQVQFKPTINVTILSVTAADPNFVVVGQVKTSNFGLDGVSVWLYTYDQNQRSVDTLYTKSNGTGYFTETIISANTGTLASSNFHLIIALASYGNGNQGLDYEIYNPAANPINNDGQTILPGTGTGFNIEVRTDQAAGAVATGVDQFAVFGGFGNNYTQVNTPGTTGGLWSQNLAVPSSGLVGIFTYQAGSIDSIAFTMFPLINDPNLHQPLSPVDPFGTKSAVYDQVISVRGVFLRYSLKTWS